LVSYVPCFYIPRICRGQKQALPPAPQGGRQTAHIAPFPADAQVEFLQFQYERDGPDPTLRPGVTQAMIKIEQKLRLSSRLPLKNRFKISPENRD
jgi:hypothetical protein